MHHRAGLAGFAKPAVAAAAAPTANATAAAAAAPPSPPPPQQQQQQQQQLGPIGVESARGVRKPGKPADESMPDKCGPLDEDDEADMVPMIDPKTGEWGGPTRGGSAPEPTRFGDWERKGRCTDFS
jgi:hypothetical protein